MTTSIDAVGVPSLTPPPPSQQAPGTWDAYAASAGGGCCCAVGQGLGGVDALGTLLPATDPGGAYPAADAPVTLSGGAPASAPVDGFPTSPTGVAAAAQEAARAQNVSPDGLVAQARRNLERANEWGLHLTGGVGTWNQWHADGSSVDVSNYAGGGVGSETPEMRAYADEMVALGRSGVTGPDGGLLVTHVVYAGMKAGASTNWQWVPVSQPDDLTQGHWDHVHVETDSWT